MKKVLTVLLTLFATVGLARTIELNAENTINFNRAFEGKFVAKKQVEAINLCANNPGSDIYVVLYTPGGSVSAGQLFFDTLKALPCEFHTITIFAASMGYSTVQNLGQRLILPSGTLMSHRASLGGVRGELGGELDSIIKYFKDNIKEMEIIAANRVGLTLKQYREKIRDELWMTASQAKENNHVDEIVLVTCSENLMGSISETIRSFFGAFKVQFSRCPLITSPIRVNGSNKKNIVKFTDYFNNITQRVRVTP